MIEDFSMRVKQNRAKDGEVDSFFKDLELANEQVILIHSQLFSLVKSGKDSDYDFQVVVDPNNTEEILTLLKQYLKSIIDLYELQIPRGTRRNFVMVNEPLVVERQIAEFERALDTLNGNRKNTDSLEAVLSDVITRAMSHIEETKNNDLKKGGQSFPQAQIDSFYQSQKQHVLEIGNSFKAILETFNHKSLN